MSGFGHAEITTMWLCVSVSRSGGCKLGLSGSVSEDSSLGWGEMCSTGAEALMVGSRLMKMLVPHCAAPSSAGVAVPG